jgi:hypothetical protein
MRHFGPAPLVEDDSVRSKSTLLVNADFGYRFQEDPGSAKDEPP